MPAGSGRALSRSLRDRCHGGEHRSAAELQWPLMKPLTLEDIADARAYDRRREDFRREVIELKKLRRVAIGPIVTVVFENLTTIRFQIQEMVRAEKMLTDTQVQTELDTYNPLLPAEGELSMTLFVELTDGAELREWLPKLVGIERAVELRLGDERRPVAAAVDPAHAAQLIREQVTTSVHYVRLVLGGADRQAFCQGPARIAVTHPAYSHETELSDETRSSLVADWG
jgi:Protein of unknown function (DUF3501)